MLAPSSNLVDTPAAVKSSFWIFGYGSLCWNPGFTYSKCYTGYVRGFSRKFWQGSVSHRGTENQPGRVATLIEDEKAVVWGCVFKITPESSAFQYLQTRECSYGGYIPKTITFYPDTGESATSTQPIQALQALTFIANDGNPFWLGHAPLNDISSQIMESKGIAGHNVEYLLRLADYMREHIPQEQDPELFHLEHLVLQQIRDRDLCITVLLSECRSEAESEKEAQQRRQDLTVRPSASEIVSSNFTRRVPDKKLRCVNI